jgi:putative SOS response-associated peptidase YedK
MVPHFAKSVADFNGFSTINAKAETLTTKAMWRGPFQHRRCLVPADCFYEWKVLDGKTKQPYAFTLRSGEPFAFGGIWDAWKEPDGGWFQSFAIVTTDPNVLAATVHNRMPVIVKPSDYDRWLTRDEAERPPVDLLRPYDAGEMTAYPVDPRVGNVRNNEPSLCEVYKRPPNSAWASRTPGPGWALYQNFPRASEIEMTLHGVIMAIESPDDFRQSRLSGRIDLWAAYRLLD